MKKCYNVTFYWMLRLLKTAVWFLNYEWLTRPFGILGKYQKLQASRTIHVVGLLLVVAHYVVRVEVRDFEVGFLVRDLWPEFVSFVDLEEEVLRQSPVESLVTFDPESWESGRDYRGRIGGKQIARIRDVVGANLAVGDRRGASWEIEIESKYWQHNFFANGPKAKYRMILTVQ